MNLNVVSENKLHFACEWRDKNNVIHHIFIDYEDGFVTYFRQWGEILKGEYFTQSAPINNKFRVKFY